MLDGAERTARLTLAFSGDGSAVLHPDATGVDRALGWILTAAYTAMIDAWPRLKTCGNDECHWAFHDQSKNHSAKWCSMQSCGNRMKARAYRARREASLVTVSTPTGQPELSDAPESVDSVQKRRT